MARILGDNQAYALKCLAEHNEGTWHPGAGWVWTNRSTTVRLLDSLVRRGFATRVEKINRRTREPYPFYEITQEGREELAKGPVALRRLLRF